MPLGLISMSMLLSECNTSGETRARDLLGIELRGTVEYIFLSQSVQLGIVQLSLSRRRGTRAEPENGGRTSTLAM